MENLKGQEQVEQQILDNIKSNKVHHAWLFKGPKGVGKATLAYKTAALLLSGGKEIKDDVYSRIKNQSHGDFLAVTSEDDLIKVDEARKIGRFLANTPAESKYRAVVIDSVDDMNTNAANAILKVLEEPPSNTVLFLISHIPAKLLPTIISRCRNLSFRPLNYDDFYQVLSKTVPIERIEKLYEISQGSVGTALALYENDAIEIYQKIEELYHSKNIAGIYKFAGEMADKWQIFKFIIRYFINKKAKERQDMLDLWDKTNRVIARTEIINLDKKQTVADILLS